MPASFIANDVAHVTNSSIFGEGVTWKGNTVVAIFEDEDIEVTTGEGTAQIVPNAMLTGQTSDFPNIARNEVVVARSATYHVKNWKQDGTGEIEVFLEKQ